MENVPFVQVLDSHYCDIKFVSVMDVMPHGTVDRYLCHASKMLVEWVVVADQKNAT